MPPQKNIIMSKWVDVSWVSQRQVGLLGNNFPSYLPPQNVFPEYVFFWGSLLTYFDKGLPHAKFPSLHSPFSPFTATQPSKKNQNMRDA